MSTPNSSPCVSAFHSRPRPRRLSDASFQDQDISSANHSISAIASRASLLPRNRLRSGHSVRPHHQAINDPKTDEHIDSSSKCIQALNREFSQLKTGLVCQRVQVAGLKEDAAMSDDLHSGPVIRNIAVATDFCPWSERALQHALVLAHYFGAVLHILQ